MNHGQELSRFNVGGKTFFFNRCKAANGQDYLAVNAMYTRGGKPQYERLVVFQSHFIEFFKAVKAAVEELGELKMAGDAPETPAAPAVECPSQCPNCGWWLRDPARNERER